MNQKTMVLLLSGGIDSPVAGYMMGRQGVRIVALSGFVNPTGEDAHVEKIGKLIERLSKAIGSEVDIYVFEQRIAQSLFSTAGKSGLTCVLCKRTMLRVAEKLCQKVGGSAIIMGDSLGQVASQTLQNMNAIEEAVSIPIVRPLVGLDKVDIVRIAEKIGSFEISNLKVPGCAFVPDKPATRARLEEILQEEARLDVTPLIEKVAATLRQVKSS
ncbi:MAG TPA: 7-cyano-7-deazaguanine synthase [Thermoplasmata archaeon]|nr:7-cyano-7-deazaguanine synthase [Thermoplasmata archaeon]